MYLYEKCIDIVRASAHAGAVHGPMMQEEQKSTGTVHPLTQTILIQRIVQNQEYQGSFNAIRLISLTLNSAYIADDASDTHCGYRYS